MRKALGEAGGQFRRLEHREHHQLVEIGAVALDARLLAHQRVAAIAADQIIGFERLRRAVARLVGGRDAHAVGVLRYLRRQPAEPGLRQRQRRQLPPQHAFEKILRDAVVLLRIILSDRFPPGEGVPMVAHQIAIGGDARGRHMRRQQAARAQFVDAAPEIEALARALRQVLAAWNIVHAGPAFDQHAGHAAHRQIHRQPDADRPAADDDDLMPLRHACSSGNVRPVLAQKRRRAQSRRGRAPRPTRGAH